MGAFISAPTKRSSFHKQLGVLDPALTRYKPRLEANQTFAPNKPPRFSKAGLRRPGDFDFGKHRRRTTKGKKRSAKKKKTRRGHGRCH